jgi:Domain of unknown function (DUF4345)
VAHQALRRASLVFFVVYVASLIAAGAWGIVGARVDMWLLLRLHTNDLPHRTAANLLSQYRFLRAIELGFGVFALTHWRRIYAVRSYNRLFLAVMAAGVAARVLSLGLDGATSWWMYLFLGWELVGVALIFLATRSGLTDA